MLSEVFSFSSCSPRRGGLAREFELRSEHDSLAFSPQETLPQGSVPCEWGLAMGSAYRPRAQFWVLGDNCLKWVTTGDVVPSLAQSML